MTTDRELGWAICERNGSLMLFDGRVPVYWLRKVAEAEAKERGFEPSGAGKDCTIQRVSIQRVKTGG